MGWGAGGGGGGVYGHRIVSVARSARHVAVGAASCPGEIDGANNQPAEETLQEMMGCNRRGAELSTKQRSCQTNYAKRGRVIRPP